MRNNLYLLLTLSCRKFNFSQPALQHNRSLLTHVYILAEGDEQDEGMPEGEGEDEQEGSEEPSDDPNEESGDESQFKEKQQKSQRDEL